RVDAGNKGAEDSVQVLGLELLTHGRGIGRGKARPERAQVQTRPSRRVSEQPIPLGRAKTRRRRVVTTIRASCPSCGDVDLTVEDVSVYVCADDRRGSYSFRCPACQLAVSKPAEPNVVDILVSSGVRMAVWQLPAELFETRMGPPISHDDLLDFHHLLTDDGWFERLA